LIRFVIAALLLLADPALAQTPANPAVNAPMPAATAKPSVPGVMVPDQNTCFVSGANGQLSCPPKSITFSDGTVCTPGQSTSAGAPIPCAPQLGTPLGVYALVAGVNTITASGRYICPLPSGCVLAPPAPALGTTIIAQNDVGMSGPIVIDAPPGTAQFSTQSLVSPLPVQSILQVSGYAAEISLIGDGPNYYLIDPDGTNGSVTVTPGETLTVTPAGTGAGTVTSSPTGITCGTTCTNSYASGATVVLTAAAGSGSSFTGWSGGGCSGTGTCSVTLAANTTVTATFANASTFALTPTTAGTGTGTITGSSSGINVSCGPAVGACSAVNFPSGTVIVLTAAAASNSTFAGWSGGTCSGSAATCSVTMSGAVAVTATFNLSAVTYETLNVNVSGSGSVTSTSSPTQGGQITCPPVACTVNFVQGTVVTLTAAAQSGATFSGWSGGGCSGTGTCSVTMSANESVTATFTSASRNVLLQPFQNTSLWNVAIGSNATYVAANVCSSGASSCPAGLYWDDDSLGLTPTATPLVGLYASSCAQWNGCNPCTTSLQQNTSVPLGGLPLPPSLTYYDAGNNAAGAVVLNDSKTVANFQPFTVCTAGAGAVYTDAYGGFPGSYWPTTNLYTDGLVGSHGGSGLSALGGTIRLADTNGPIAAGTTMNHVLKIEQDGLFNSFGTGTGCCNWPATNNDGGNEGLLLAILPSFNCATQMSTNLGKSICLTMQNYGALIVDNPGWSAIGFAWEYSVSSNGASAMTTAPAQYFSNTGFYPSCGWSGAPGGNSYCYTALRTDIQTIMHNIQVVTSYGGTALSGCTPYSLYQCNPSAYGTPRQALLPAVTAP
jgi:hypothetical protein